MSEKFVLSEPIRANGADVTELVLREPTTRDVNELGLPYRLHPDLSTEPKPAVCARFISRLASIPPSAVEKICLTDYTMLLYMIVSFFNASRQKQQES